MREPPSTEDIATELPTSPSQLNMGTAMCRLLGPHAGLGPSPVPEVEGLASTTAERSWVP